MLSLLDSIPITPGRNHFDSMLHELPSLIALPTNPDFAHSSSMLDEHDFPVQRASSHSDLSPHQARRRARSSLHPQRQRHDPCGPSPTAACAFRNLRDAEAFSCAALNPSSASDCPPSPDIHVRASSISSLTSVVTQSLESWRNSWSTANDLALAEMDEPQTPRQIADARQRDLFLLVL